MPIVPSKLSYQELGGTFADYTEVADPSTDLSANQYCAMSASVAAMSQTPIKVFGAVAIDGTLEFSGTVWGSAANQPTSNFVSSGIVEIICPATITDLQGNDQSLNLLCAWGMSCDPARMISVTRLSNTSFRFTSTDQTGTPTSQPFYFFIL